MVKKNCKEEDGIVGIYWVMFAVNCSSVFFSPKSFFLERADRISSIYIFFLASTVYYSDAVGIVNSY